MDETRILRPAGANGASAEQALSRAGVYRHQAFAPRLLFHSQSLKVTPESPSPQVSACLVAKNFHMYVYLSLSLPLSPSPSLFLALFFFCISLSLSDARDLDELTADGDSAGGLMYGSGPLFL